jgi:haloacetate dehalogenase
MGDPLFPGFTARAIDVGDGVQIHTVTGGEGPPLLLLHGYPQTHALWHRVAPVLARHFSLVLCDLRGYGDSSKPAGGDDHAAYSKRTMARDMAEVMRRLGHERFAVLAHDRGARVAHRLAMDHASRVGRLVLLDIAPTLAMYQRTSEAFARAYWHWFFLIQPAPLPERAIQADTAAWLQDTMARRFPSGVLPFDPRAWAEYERCIAGPAAAHAMCEDYRASAGIDLVHDRADREARRRLAAPLLVLWGRHGVIERCFDPLAEWRAVADDVQGAGLPCGHYLAEEAPEDLLREALPFLQAG